VAPSLFRKLLAMEPSAFEKGDLMALTKDFDNVPRKFFGGSRTPKAVSVDLCVHPEDRNRPLQVSSILCRTYKGRVTKDELRRIKFALDEVQAVLVMNKLQGQRLTAMAWFPRYGWHVVARKD